jgi:hypothetical protein
MRGLLSSYAIRRGSDGRVVVADVVVANAVGHRGIRVALVEATGEAGCEILHVDFDTSAKRLYLDSCGLKPTNVADRCRVEGPPSTVAPHGSGGDFEYRRGHR